MTTWILLRGLTRESRHWGDFPAQLARHFPHARIVALDLPGNGVLNREASPWYVAGMAMSGREALKAMEVEGPYHLLAMSLGAMVAVAWADQHPDEIAGTVLINASLGGASPFYRRLRPRAWWSLLRIALESDARSAEQRIFALTSRRTDGSAIVERWAELRRTYPVSRSNALRQLVAAARFRGHAGRPTHPVLILSSVGDGLVSSSCSLDLATQWGCSSAVHPLAGHDLPLDDGEWVADRISEWYSRNYSNRR